ncbi:hypothetical protein ANN_14012 [Periplaneta americana]|uniref:Uncharacterized protein n=1 Tax=Periplaneta americana TaxID=6978 RepID=A0ABQ8SV39_PERAM|nr:hypothetical protein ANN_14012 [Periplaneta americana]
MSTPPENLHHSSRSVDWCSERFSNCDVNTSLTGNLSDTPAFDNHDTSTTTDNDFNLNAPVTTSCVDISSDSSDFVTCHLCPSGSAKLFKGSRGLRVHWSRAHPNIPFAPNNIPFPKSSLDDFQTCLIHSKQHIHVLRRIPKGARALAASRLSHFISQCLSQNSVESWYNLLLFAYIALRVPEKSGKKSLVSKIKDNINNFQIADIKTSSKSFKSSHVRHIEQKVADCDIRGAVRILSSDDGVADFNISNYQALLDKHPVPSRPNTFPDPLILTDHLLKISEDNVIVGLRSFPKGSVSGIDGLRPQHLQDLVSISAGDSGKRLLISISNLCGCYA